MSRRPTSRVTVLSIISELSPISADDGAAVQTICNAAQSYGITKGACRQQVDSLRKLGMIDTLTERGKMFMVELTPKGVKYLEQNAIYIKSREVAESKVVRDPLPSVVELPSIKLGSLEFFEACKQAEAMVKEMVSTISLLSKKVDQAEAEVESLRQTKAQLEAKNLSQKEEIKSLQQKLAARGGSEDTLRPAALPKDLRELAEKAIAQGWSINLTASGHIRWASPSGVIVTSSQTPSDHRSFKNTRAELARSGLKVR